MDAERRAGVLLRGFAAEQASADSEALCARVCALFDQYSGGLLDALQNTALSVEAEDASRIRDRSVALMVGFATALRDAIADSRTRHAAAQLIQCKVLEYERQLRLAVEPLSKPAPAAELASPKT